MENIEKAQEYIYLIQGQKDYGRLIVNLNKLKRADCPIGDEYVSPMLNSRFIAKQEAEQHIDTCLICHLIFIVKTAITEKNWKLDYLRSMLLSVINEEKIKQAVK